MSLRFALEQLNPAMRAQAEAKLRASATVTVHSMEPKTPEPRVMLRKPPGRPKGAKDTRPRKRLGQVAPPISKPAARLLWHIRAANLPEPAKEHRFHPTRMWRFDFAWPDLMVAMEVDGVTHLGGRHQRPAGYTNDARKYNAAIEAGWKLYRVTQDMVRRGEAIALLERVIVPRGTNTQEAGCT